MIEPRATGVRPLFISLFPNLGTILMHVPADELPRIVDRYERPLLAYAARMLGDTGLAQDAVQETFLRLCRRSGTPDDDEKAGPESTDRLAAWLFSVCRHRVIDMKRKHVPQSIDQIDTAVMDETPPPGAAMDSAEDQQQLAETIQSLSARQREVLQLRMQAGLSYREIAEVTGLSVNNVGFHLHQAIKTLRTRLCPLQP